MNNTHDTRMTAAGLLVQGIRRGIGARPAPEAVEAVEELLPEGHEFGPYLARFAMLIVLSAAIASYGLLDDSSAVVIGAMLVAPLMTPITAAGAAIVMARNVRLLRSLVVIALGAAGAIAVGFVIAKLSGTAITSASELPNEVKARTSPGLLDLGIAVTAGAAAGYIAPRRSAFSALPGVGIAVALVPPLATVGICVEVGALPDAANAFLLFVTNLAAIVFSVVVMLMLAGFRPDQRGIGSMTVRLIITLTAVAAVAIPLTVHTRSVLREGQLQRSVTAAVAEWDDSVRVIELDAEASGGRASVRLLLSGPNPARPAWQLASGIERRFRGSVDLRLLYQRDNLFQVSVR